MIEHTDDIVYLVSHISFTLSHSSCALMARHVVFLHTHSVTVVIRQGTTYNTNPWQRPTPACLSNFHAIMGILASGVVIDERVDEWEG